MKSCSCRGSLTARSEYISSNFPSELRYFSTIWDKQLTWEIEHWEEKSALRVVDRVLKCALCLHIARWKPGRIAHDQIELLRHSKRDFSSSTNRVSFRQRDRFLSALADFISKNSSTRSAWTVLICSSSPNNSVLSSVASIATPDLSRAQIFEHPILARMSDNIPVPQPRSITFILSPPSHFNALYWSSEALSQKALRFLA